MIETWREVNRKEKKNSNHVITLPVMMIRQQNLQQIE